VGCEVWWASRDQAGAAGVLARDDERRRAARFLRPADRERSLLGSVLLRVAAAAALGVDAGGVRLTRTCPRCGTSAAPDAHGRPAVVGSDLGLSSSHSGDVVVVATAVGPGVGVDVELARDLDDAVLADVLGPGEPHPGTTGAAATALWVRKESALKATGEGLTVSPRRVRLTPGRDGTWDAVREGDDTGPERHGTTWDLTTAAGHPTAVTVLQAGSGDDPTDEQPPVVRRVTRWPGGAGGAGGVPP
jgi:4'-phosphopantetheinyl transferase